MTENDLEQLKILHNILAIFVSHNEHCSVSLDNETVVFNAKTFDVSYKEDLIEAGATYDLARGCWTYWSDKS